MFRKILLKLKNLGYKGAGSQTLAEGVGGGLAQGPNVIIDPFEGLVLNRNEDSFIEPDKLGSRVPVYKPTYDFQGPFINKEHEFYSTCKLRDNMHVDVGIPGWLWRWDALKLYELAYFTTGDILELGTYQGLSTSILTQANIDSGLKKHIYTVDMNSDSLRAAEGYLKDRGTLRNIDFFCSDATSFCNKLIEEKRKFSFIFVDHSHEYQPVLELCRLLDKLISRRGFCLFHDFNDPQNNDPNAKDYGVSTAVYDGLPLDEFEFYGIFGCTALYRAKL